MFRSRLTLYPVVSLLSFFGFASMLPAAWAISFQPPSPAELSMTSEPKAPGAPAIILYRQVDRDDRGRTAHEDVYFRIKIFTEAGRKYADVEIPFTKDRTSVTNLHARTIKPDGTIVNFSGKVMEQTIEKARGLKVLAKTLTLPDIQPGCIIEYYYTTDFDESYVFDSHWILSDSLFTKNARFSLKPFAGYNSGLHVRWTWHSLPTGTAAPEEVNDVVNLEANNVPAFEPEDYMPPENEMKSRVDFIYTDESYEKDADKYWKKLGKKLNGQLDGFAGKRAAMEQAVGEIVAAGDSPEVKLRKIYTRVQQIRNISYELKKTEQEEKRENEKPINNVEDLWKRQYGNGQQLTWLFLALARAAGFEASGMRVPDRKNYFFTPQTMDGRRLDANVVVIKLDGKDVFFDPGAAFVPFGMLPWEETGIKGLRLDKDGGSWLQTSLPDSSQSGIRRKAELKLTETGEVEGKLTVTYAGLDAWSRRVSKRLSDDAERKRFLEEEVKEFIPVGCEVDLTNTPQWKSSDPTLVAEFSLKVPGWVSGSGKHALLPLGLFSAPEKHVFDHANRVLPVYFEYPSQRVDDVSIDLPLGWQITNLPAPHKQDTPVITYSLKAENDKGTLHVSRILNVDILLLDAKYYPALRSFYQLVRTSDEEQVMLQANAAVGGN